MRRQARGLILIALLVALCISVVAIPRIEFEFFGAKFERGNVDNFLGLSLGLDLRGGTHLVYKALERDGGQPNSEDMEGVRRVIESRVNQFGLSEPTVQLLGTPPDRVLIQMPGLAGATITVSFSGNAVSPEELEEFLRSDLIGHNEAEVFVVGENDDEHQLVARFESLEPAVMDATGKIIKLSEGERIREVMASKFPVVLNVMYPIRDGVSTTEGETPTPAPDLDLPSVDLISEELAAIGLVDTEVTQDDPALPSFTIRISNPAPDSLDADGELIEGDITTLRAALSDRFGPPSLFGSENGILGYTIGGGIQEAKQLIGQTAQLEFRERTCGSLLPPNADTTEWPPDGLSEIEWMTERCSNPKYYSEAVVAISGDDLVDAFAGTQPGVARPVVNIEFNSEGADEFFRVTDRIARTRGLLAIYLDGEELVAPSAQQGISGGKAFIQGPDFTPERSRTIAIQLRSGALPLELDLVQERNVDSTLGADSLQKSLVAGAVGLGLILGFMIFYYKAPGVVASMALLMYATVLIAVFKLTPVTLTLSGVAALILSIGTAVDANVLIAERTKEELRAGRSLLAAINAGFSRAWPSIRDSNVSTIITAAVLFWFGDRLGTSLMQGFAIVLAVGTLVSMFTAYFASRILMRSLATTFLGARLRSWVPIGGVGGEDPT